MTESVDHFSERADVYARYRPTYPQELAAFVAATAPGRVLVWEAGCGSGQFTATLAGEFGTVHATDASEAQVARAAPRAGVDFRVERADECSLSEATADAVVAAQAAHWFPIEGFYGEVRRVARPGAVVALVTYGPTRIDAALDPVVGAFQYETLAGFWPPERRHVESGYATLPFPFAKLATPELVMAAEWEADAFVGYVRSWSGVRALLAAGGEDALRAFEEQVRGVWGPGARRVTWPLTIVAGRI